MIGRRTNYRCPCLQKKMGQQSGMEIRISLESEVLLVSSIYFVTLLQMVTYRSFKNALATWHTHVWSYTCDSPYIDAFAPIFDEPIMQTTY